METESVFLSSCGCWALSSPLESDTFLVAIPKIPDKKRLEEKFNLAYSSMGYSPWKRVYRSVQLDSSGTHISMDCEVDSGQEMD